MSESSDEELCCSDGSSEEDEGCMLLLNKDLVPKLTNRKKNKSEAKWISEGHFTGMAEVTKFRGNTMKSIGINRDSRVLLHIEEMGYMLQREALILWNGDSVMNIMDIYSKIMMGAYGCTWEAFKVYLELKNLGYVIRRHNILWSSSSLKSKAPQKSPQQPSSELNNLFDKLEIRGTEKSICGNQHIDPSGRAPHLMFDVFSPNCNFKKTNPGTPDFSLFISSHVVPDKDALEDLNTQNDGIPVTVAIVDSSRVTFFQFDDVQLPLLP